MLSEVNGASCRAYAKSRGSNGGARRDLEDLRAAINHHAKEGLHRGIVRVALPEKGPPRERWLDRGEAARLLWACWRYRETQTIHVGPLKGQKIETDKRPLRHIARFILIGLYTGTRAGAIASASPFKVSGKSYVDLAGGIFYRLAIGRRAATKRQTPVPLLSRLLTHLERWTRLGLAKSHFVAWNGRPVASVKTAFASGVRLAKLDLSTGNVTPHTLRHTAATWLMQAGAPMWEAAGFLGMSEKTLRETYGHHHPDYLCGAANAVGPRQAPKKNVVLVDRLVGAKSKSTPPPQALEKAGDSNLQPDRYERRDIDLVRRLCCVFVRVRSRSLRRDEIVPGAKLVRSAARADFGRRAGFSRSQSFAERSVKLLANMPARLTVWSFLLSRWAELLASDQFGNHPP